MKHLTADIVTAPTRPIRIIQFGEGNFLRAFLDWQVQQMNNAGLFNGSIAVVQPLATGRIADLETQDRLYTTLIEGIKDGEKYRKAEVNTSIAQTVNPYVDWDAYLGLADNPDARIVVSNTTEAGIALDDADTAETIPPKGFPAKLTHLLHRRFENKLPGFVIIPCELIDDNGVALKAAVHESARRFGFGDEFAAWIDAENTFCSSLVDRIVPGYPREQEQALWEEFGYEDHNIVKAEPFLLWVIEGPAWVADVLPLQKAGISAIIATDLKPYHDRKVFLLNGPHTTMAALARLDGIETVGDVMADTDFRAFIEAEMNDDIMPVVDLPHGELVTFAHQVEERFENPYVHHSLDSIALNGVSKYTARLLPVVHANAAKGRPLPRRVVLALAGILYTYAGRGGEKAKPFDGPDVRAIFEAALTTDDYIGTILADKRLWGSDLTEIPGLAQLVRDDFASIETAGVRATIAALATASLS